jgi:hypothetical protein
MIFWEASSVRVYVLPLQLETLLRTEGSAPEKNLDQTEASPSRFRSTRRYL